MSDPGTTIVNNPSLGQTAQPTATPITILLGAPEPAGLGISRNMQSGTAELQAGGDQNGSTNGHMKGQAGTGCDRLSLPRQSMRWNYCGVV